MVNKERQKKSGSLQRLTLALIQSSFESWLLTGTHGCKDVLLAAVASATAGQSYRRIKVRAVAVIISSTIVDYKVDLISC